MKNFTRIVLLLCICLLYIACQPKESAENAGGEPQVTPAAGQSAVKDDVSAKDVVKIAVGSKDHTTLVAALKAAELVDVLSNAGPFTVFAPTNAAFDKLPKGTVETLLKPENKGKLSTILQHHVTVAVYKPEMLKNGKVLGMVDGSKAKISIKDGSIYIDDAKILASVVASNGIIHVIDACVLPPEKK
ncbi:MAG: beta-Ig-H3/fasciclin [Ignavibacteria bacterium]|nr:beta-Ig-H3/fasciclin [Ignavibacteria bacterium]